MRGQTGFLSSGLLVAGAVALAGCSSPGQLSGGLLGGAAGGYAGSQFGKGEGRVAATGLGAAIGAAAGSNLGGAMDRANQLPYGHPPVQAVPPTGPVYYYPVYPAPYPPVTCYEPHRGRPGYCVYGPPAYGW